MSIINAVILGFVQGFTEFFPISSSGHMAILSSLFNLTDSSDGYMLFCSMVHLGSLFSLAVVFWQDITNMLYECGALFNVGPLAGKQQSRMPYARQLLMMTFSTLPLFLVLVFRKRLPVLNSNSAFVGTMFILNGCILYVADKMHKGNKNERSITVLDSLIIGLCQCAAAIPGISRVGVGAAAGIANGLDSEYSLKYAFLISIPALFGANLLGLIDALKIGTDIHNIPAFLVGTVCSILGGIASITLMKRLFSNAKFGGFTYYCWLVGAISIILTMIF